MRIAFLSWRDSTHPEGGGAEHYIETIARHLVTRGHEVTIFCAAHDTAPSFERLDGVILSRRGGRFSVYASALRRVRSAERRGRPYDVVVDVQNGIPFFTALALRTPLILLCHHVHREQWPVVFGPVISRVGWFIESQVSPRIYARHPYVAVSDKTKEELVELGVGGGRVSVIHNGTDSPRAAGVERSADPTLLVLGRLVPHKRVEHAIDVLARLLPMHPNLTLRVVGHGWWHDQVAEHARMLGVEDAVHLLGFIGEEEKHTELAKAWVALAPSIKEGWGLCVVEAASHGVPTVAYANAGGLSESIQDGVTGVLVNSHEEMTTEVGRLICDSERRRLLGEHAAEFARTFTWEGATDSWEVLLELVRDGLSEESKSTAPEPETARPTSSTRGHP